MNVLLTSVGRRSYLVRYFQQAVRDHGEVITTNSHANAPGMHAADHAEVLPPSFTDGYLEAVLDVCRRHRIGLLCSCHDLDVFALAKGRDALSRAGVSAMLPDADWGLACLDKFECGRRLAAAGFAVPWSSVSIKETKTALALGIIDFPLIVKARLGFGSLGLSRCFSLGELEAQVRRARDELRDTPVNDFINIPAESSVLIQQHLPGPERCLDIVNDLSGRYAGHFVCEVHAMRAGESDSATTLDPDVLGDLPLRFSAFTQHPGIWGIDVMMNDGQPKIIDVNPRFTGDYPFQQLAGANVPAALCAWAEGRPHDPQWLKPAVGVAAYKDLVPTRIPPAIER